MRVILAVEHATKRYKLPTRFAALVGELPPQAIMDDAAYHNTLEMIDRLMVSARLTKDQELYLETLVQLVQGYEAGHHAIDTSGIGAIALLRHLLDENDMHASDLARLLGIHPSMGSKIIKGERALTIAHVKKLAARFKLRPDAFID